MYTVYSGFRQGKPANGEKAGSSGLDDLNSFSEELPVFLIFCPQRKHVVCTLRLANFLIIMF